MIKRKLPKYAMGVGGSKYSQYGNIGADLSKSGFGLANYIDTYGTNLDGTQTGASAAGSGALQGASFAAPIALNPATLAATGGLSALAVPLAAGIGATTKFFGNKRRNAQIEEQNADIAQQEAEAEAEREEQQRKLEAQQQLNYSRSYYSANPSGGQLGASVYAYGTNNLRAANGNLVPVSSNVKKVNGASHANGGVDLQAGNTPIAEVEGGETIINDNAVASDRISLPNGKTVAEETERIGKEISKNEEKLKSSITTEKNTAKRNIQNLNQELEKLLAFQDQYKQANGIQDGSMPVMRYGGKLAYGSDGINPRKFAAEDYRTSQLMYNLKPNTNITHDPADDEVIVPEYNPNITATTKLTKPILVPEDEEDNITPPVNTTANARTPFNYSGITKGITDATYAAAPYLDNIVNLRNIKRAPNVPIPNMLKANLVTAMPMKTTYNINPALNEANDDYRTFSKNLDDNISNSAITRGNKLAGFAKVLENKSKLYGQKENIETQLKNQDSANRQVVSNVNARNFQDVENANLAKLDMYNEKKAARLDDNRRELSKNVSNLSSDFKTTLYDQDRKRVYNAQMLTDALQYRDGASAAQLLETSYMDDYISNNPSNYKQVESVLQNQPEALKKFYQKYGKR